MTRTGQNVVVLDVALVELARDQRDNKGTIYSYCNCCCCCCYYCCIGNCDATVFHHRRGHRWQLWCAGLLHGGQPEASGHQVTRLTRPRP